MTASTKSEPHGTKVTLSERLENFLRENRRLLLIILLVIIVAIVGVAVVLGVQNARSNAANLAYEALSQDSDALQNEYDEAKKAEKAKALSAKLEDVFKAYPKDFAGAQALLQKIDIAIDQKDWATGSKDADRILANFPKNKFITLVALQKAAFCAEESGDAKKALTYYVRISSFDKNEIGVAHAYFSIGRINEGLKDFTAAATAYKKLINDYAGNDYAKLAHDRIIALKLTDQIK